MSLDIKGDVISASKISVNNYIKTDLSGPIMVAFDITNRCNFKCLHCFNRSGENIFNDELTDKEKLDVVDQIIELKPYLVCLCGGETTCCNVLIPIIEKLSKHVPTVNIVSNGYLIDKKMAHNLKMAGVSSVQISLDGINAEQHDTFRGKYGAFEHAIQAVKNLREENITVLSSLVPNKLSYKDTYKYFQMCHELGIVNARCMPYLPMGRAESLADKLELNSEEYNFMMQELMRAKIDFPAMKIEWGDPIDHTYRMPNNAILGMDSFSMDIRSNGDIGISAYFPVVIGNCKKHTLKEYWDAGYKKIWSDKNLLAVTNEIENIKDFSKISKMKGYKIDIMEG